MCEKSREWLEPGGGGRGQMAGKEAARSPIMAGGWLGSREPQDRPFDRGGPRSLPEGVCPGISVTVCANAPRPSLLTLFALFFPNSCKLTPSTLVPQCCQKNGARNHTLLLCGGKGWPFSFPHHCVAFALK